jgi:RNA polymerase sigma factor (sigma-70 family)
MIAVMIPVGAPRIAPRDDGYHRQVPETGVGDGLGALDVSFARGEADLAAVYAAHGSLIYGISCKALGHDAAGDVTQEVFVSAWRSRHQFDPERGSLAAWLVGITKRRIVDHLRRERRHVEHRVTADVAAVPIESEVERITERMTVARALANLPERPRRVIGLAYVYGLTHQEIAERTGFPLGTIKSDIRRGLVVLRDQLHRELAESHHD